jgi:hypothetical protein
MGQGFNVSPFSSLLHKIGVLGGHWTARSKGEMDGSEKLGRPRTVHQRVRRRPSCPAAPRASVQRPPERIPFAQCRYGPCAPRCWLSGTCRNRHSPTPAVPLTESCALCLCLNQCPAAHPVQPSAKAPASKTHSVSSPVI